MLQKVSGQVTKLGEHPVAEGGTADIYEGRWVGDEKVMLKAIRHVGSESAIRRFQREVDIWRRLEHKNILRFYGICYIGPRLFAVAPWAEGGSLQAFIRKNPECDRMRFLSEVASGLKYLHSFRPMIVHGDLRATNVVVSASEEALLTDFGLSRIVAEEEGVDVASTSLENAGSSRWMAPELFQASTNTSSSGVTSASDVWSFGMLCLEVLTGQPPFYPNHRIDGQVIASLIQGNLPERPEPKEAMYRRGLSEEMWKLMNQCWEWKPTARPEMRTLASDVRKLHTEHLRKYGVTSLCPLNDSPRTLNNELPKTPAAPYVPGTGAIPIPRTPQRLDTTAQSFSGLNLGSSPDSGFASSNWQRSLDRSPTIAKVPQYRPRAGSILSRESGVAGPHPEGHAIINYDEQGHVLTGNLEGLVMRLLHSTNGRCFDQRNWQPVYQRREFIAAAMDKEFRECFITVYRGFARVEDLWPMLVDRYKSEMSRVITAYNPLMEQTKLKDSMLANLNDWLELQAIEPKDQGFLLDIQDFINQSFVDEPLDANWGRLQEKLRGHLIDLNRSVSRAPSTAAGRKKWSELDPATVAKQLMKIESDLFQKILPSDCATRLKNISDEALLNIPRFFKNNYRVEDWCLSLILFIDANEIEKRAQAITFLKRVAEVWKSIKELMKYQSPQPNITRDPDTAGYLEHEFAKIDGNPGLQDELKAKSEELHRKEVRDFNLRRLGMEDAGFRPPKRR
ncbi:hypothetical protein FRC11_000801 [Ceratobasidium sp. 423]|nr:hypothetical protein FRC11_000801 [Ceratobasidium sp. 423]